MYLLDTNVLSEVRRRTPAAMDWLSSVDVRTTYISVVSLGEIMKGIEIKMSSDAQLAHRLLAWLDSLHEHYANRILPVNVEIALAWGRIEAGRTRGTPDALIAATALSHDYTLVSRNVRDFRDLPVRLVNPWGS